jgi:TonB-dependent receptor
MIITEYSESRRFAVSRLMGAASAAVIAATLAATPAAARDTAATEAQQDATQPAPTEVAQADAQPQTAPVAPDQASTVARQQSEANNENTIVVTGFRRSINEALNIKREATSQVDAIVAEDIAKFPDQNLAESLQRIPGVAIERDAGEGRAITVRGLGSQFTRVRVNGMETIATSVNGASFTNDRSFDFNIFASELFSSLVVHKTAEASLDEGSLGAVVDLNTGNPLSYHTGLTAVASAQARYNDLNNDLSPRLAGLVGWVNDSKTFGMSASLAYQDYDTAELGNNSVRWAQASFRSVDGVNCASNPADSGCSEVAGAFHPRIPRYGLVNHGRTRLGATASLQFAPDDATNISIDGLYSKFRELRDEHWGEVLLRSNEKGIDISNYTIDSDNNIISADLENVWVRTERYHRESKTKFYQLSARASHDFGSRFHAALRGGFSKSDADIPVETTLAFDDRDATGYSYDYSDMTSPLLTFSSDITNPSAFQLAEFRDRPSGVTNKFKTAALDLRWDVTDGFKLSAGPFVRQFDYSTAGYSRDSTYCAAFTCAPGQYGAPVTDSISDIFELGEAGQPSGNSDSWVEPDLDSGTDLVGLYDRTPVLQQGSVGAVREKVKGGWAQADVDTHFGSMRFTGNIGLRYANTDQTSSGYVSGTLATVDRKYHDWLPAANANLYLRRDLILRLAAAKVITRPDLGTLTPGGSVDQFNYRITSGNPNIDPYRATNYDLSLEWYFAREGLASVALFKKDVKSFPLGGSIQGTWADSGLPTSILTSGTPLYCAIVGGSGCDPASFDPNHDIEFRTTVNGPGAKVKGVEFQVNLPFSLFTPALRNFGAIGNLTLIDSKVDYNIGGNVYTEPLIPLSKKQANGTLFYDDGKFSVRVSGSYRGKYITSTSGNSNIFEGFGSSFNLDAAIRYQMNEHVELSLDGTNLTDEYRYRWTDLFANRNYENNHFGRTFVFGVRYKY